MKKNLVTAILMTLATTLLLGIGYPLLVTGLSQILFRDKANGQLIVEKGKVVGSHLIGQPFSGRGYFHSRPSAAGMGYDAANSGPSNLGPTNQKLIDRVSSAVAAERLQNSNWLVPIDLVTTSASGLDPDISPAAALFQVARVARERGFTEQAVQSMVQQHLTQRQLGFLGEPRVNVLELNLALDATVARKPIEERRLHSQAETLTPGTKNE